MSHFVALVIGAGDLAKQLAPFHEFECTGLDNEYVQNIDITEEARKSFDTDTTTVYRDTEGKYHQRFTPEGEWDIRYWRIPTPEELVKWEVATGASHDVDIDGEEYYSTDWKDGLTTAITRTDGSIYNSDYTVRIKTLPEGWTEERIPTKEVETFAEWVKGYYGTEILFEGEEPDLTRDKHKYGHVLVNAEGEVLQVIDRTNPLTTRVHLCSGFSTTNPINGGIGNAEGIHNIESAGKEIMSPVWTDEDIRRVFESNQEQGRKIHVLSSLHEGTERFTDSGATPALASSQEVRADSGTVPATSGEAKWDLFNLQAGGEREGIEREILSSGPQPHKWEGSRALVQSVQHLIGTNRGEVTLGSCNAGVPHIPHVISAGTVSGTKWDWYQVGGRWTGYFKVKPGVRPILGETGSLRTASDYVAPAANESDIVRKGDVDVEAMRDAAGARATKEYDLFASVTEGLPKAISWLQAQADHKTEAGETDWSAARDFYHAQPLVQAIQANRDTMWFDLEDFECTREEYIARHRNRAMVPRVVLKDGVWSERCETGWWGMEFNPTDRDEWDNKFNELFASLPDDSVLTAVDCHV